MSSSHDYKKDKRNNNIKIYINGKYYLRNKAKISVFDSSVMLGDGCWDSLRYHNKKFIFLNEHMKRLYKDAKLLDIKIHLKRKELIKALYKTLKINKMTTDVHLRIIVSRGLKSTPYQSPKVTISKPTIIIIPEYKKPDNNIYKRGLKLVTVRTIRGPKNVQDPQINSLSKLNCILACIEASKKGGEEALMFDINGNIATNNSTHFFYIKNNIVYTSTGKYCVTGITRQKVIDLCKKNKIIVKEMNFKLKNILNADEAFATGTFAGIVPIRQINNKKFSIKNENLTFKILYFYNQLINQ
ncbi:MAG: D-alanine aminotransferase [Alphaproteobacteria bacterium MarineAlpha5_Bin5]|nr:MAG: D-alanine aminotransferase [Alphaproteobacteria bacterium MarineAlpha5_Bin5]PPR50207.1 MAG: D-alanine aminotransferase [Alphaproteobacteria bacterium MarineAlpha5_Bin4]|tara:strand:+ start:4054 stop:4950 length:897 start_codon:yes stop_codon:yes gene_type:complete